MELQSRTISRGPNSLFGRLRKEDIEVGAKLILSGFSFMSDLTAE
jgi:hypothetical protein